MKTGIELISEERHEQVAKHGWTNDHDQQHRNGELRVIAATLLCMGTDARVDEPTGEMMSGANPWGLEEKLKKDIIHRLKVAGALVAAEIDRIENIQS